MKPLLRTLAAVAASCTMASSFAGPMGFKESWMAMGDFGPNWREAFVNYAITPRDAVGAAGLYMRSDDKRRTRDLAELTYTRLLHRWNLPEAQANIWFIGGLGNLRGSDFAGTKTMLAPGIQVDYETTRVYASAFGRMYRAPDINHDFLALRAGASFYEVDYDETQPWILVEVRRMRGLSEKTEVTPLVRLIHNRYFVELGVNNMRQARFNFMYIF